MKLLHLFFGLFSLYSGCDGCKVCQKNFTFELPINLTPALSEYKIGDTINISSKFSKDMVDVITGERIRVENYDFGCDMLLSQDDNIRPRFAISYFDVKKNIGDLKLNTYAIGDTTLVGGDKGIGGSYRLIYENTKDEYLLQYKIIPQRKGLYSIHFDFSLQREDANLLKDCGTSIDLVKFNVNNRTNNHYDLRQKSPSQATRNISKEELDRGVLHFLCKVIILKTQPTSSIKSTFLRKF